MPKIITKNANKKLGKNKLKKVGPSSWLSKKIYSEKQAVAEIFGHIRQVRIFETLHGCQKKRNYLWND